MPLHVDHARLSQVFANLLNNAAKYSDAGGSIDVVATVAGDTVEVSVRDTGIGLASEQIEHIFELFSQADTAIEKAHGGLGIGLTLVQHLVGMHEGSVTVQSGGLGKGSEFRVSLPRDPALTLPERAPGAASPARSFDSLRARWVDDNRYGRRHLRYADRSAMDTRRLDDSLQGESAFASFAAPISPSLMSACPQSCYDLAATCAPTPNTAHVVLSP